MGKIEKKNIFLVKSVAVLVSVILAFFHKKVWLIYDWQRGRDVSEDEEKE